MFGYIKAFKPELRVKELEMYKAVYCTLCRELGRSYGLAARFTLSYDFTFLALLKMSLNSDTCSFERKCCSFNPLKKCNYCTSASDDIDFSAAAAMLLLYYKLRDNLDDEKGIRRLKYILLYPIFRRAYKRAKQRYPQMDGIFSRYTERQSQLEGGGVSDIDAAAEPTAVMLAELFESCSESESDRKALNRLGYCMGRYIYILDAAVDYKDDIKRGRYNPYDNYKGDITESVKRQLYVSVNEAAKAFELIEFQKFKNILGNIVCVGLEDTFIKELKQ